MYYTVGLILYYHGRAYQHGPHKYLGSVCDLLIMSSGYFIVVRHTVKPVLNLMYFGWAKIARSSRINCHFELVLKVLHNESLALKDQLFYFELAVA